MILQTVMVMLYGTFALICMWVIGYIRSAYIPDSLLAMFIVFSIPIVIGMYITHPLMDILGIASDNVRTWFMLALIFLFFLSTVMGSVTVPVIKILSHPVALNEAVEVNKIITVLKFKEGRVYDDMMSYSIESGGSRSSGSHPLYNVYVAPVLPDNWKKGDPVHVWAVWKLNTYYYRAVAGDKKDWKESSLYGVRVYGDTEPCRKAAVHIEKRYGFTHSDKEPVFVFWSAEPDRMIAESAAFSLKVNIVFILIFNILVLFVRLRFG